MPVAPSRAFGIANGAAALAFLASAAVQYNDPDPWRWVALYGAAAFAALSWRRLPLPAWLAPGLVALAALAWAAALAPRVLPDLVVTDLVRPMNEKTPAIEEGREMLGLLLVAGWMVVLAVRGRRASGAG